MRTKDLKVLLVTAFVLALSLPAGAQYRFSGVDRIVAMSDPHGAYDSMVRTLQKAGIVDDQADWAGGETHLVITGDLLDRGADSRRIMDLVMHLEEQAPQAGGMVHLTLGNHEVMNLVGDLRYVAHGEYAAFASEEPAEEREKWFQALLSERRLASENEVDESALRAEFDELRPPGFYAHRRAFGSEGKYGRWLLQKPMVIVINDTAFVHGGLSPVVAEVGLDRLNDQMRAQVADYVVAFETLAAAGLVDPAINFYDHADIAETLLADPNSPPALHGAMSSVVELNDAPVHDSDGPLWYRGNVGCSILTEGEALDASLAAIGASRVVIGHTPTPGRRVLERFGGRVIEIDTGMLKAAYGGSGFALVVDAEGLSVVQEEGAKRIAPVPHPRQVGDRVDNMDADALEDLLASGEIISETEDDAGRRIVELSRDDITISAIFTRSPRRKNLDPELAAFELDRLLGLDLVPVTVSREVDGQRGTLQYLPPRARDEVYRSTTGQGGGAWCPLPRQWNSLYIFDVLAGNNGRTPASMFYNTSNWQLMSIGHERAFGTRPNRPAYLEEMTIDVTSAWMTALQALSDERLNEALAEVLPERQIKAIATRRDLLLEGRL